MTGTTPPLLEVCGLVRDYRLPRRRLLAPAPRFRALHGIDLHVEAGRSLGIVGESGCGKSTLARTVLALEKPTAGTVRLRGEDLFALSARRLQAMRRHVSIIFQDPYGSLDPRQRVGRIVAEPMTTLMPELGHRERRHRVAEALDAVGLPATALDKYPHEFSGGQRQRIAIARALITRPDLIVADEPVSALDVSVQAQVLNLMMDLQEQLGLTYLFISHDLAIVRCVTDEVAVMYLGRIVERAPTAALFEAPLHPYTRALLDAVPRPDPSRRRHRLAAIGETPRPGTDEKAGSAGTEPGTGHAGCPFAPRCPQVQRRCRSEAPGLRSTAPGHRVACHFA